MTDTPLDLDAILANAEVGRATYLPHLDQRDLRAIDRARKRATDDVPALVTALRDAQAQVAAVLALHAPHGRLDDLHCAQHCPGSYPCATARAAGAS